MSNTSASDPRQGAAPDDRPHRHGRGRRDETGRGGGAGVARGAGGTHPDTVGWWHPPKAGSRAQGTRHRSGPDAAGHPHRSHRRRRLSRTLLGVGVLAVLGLGVAFVVGYVLLPVPTPDEVVDRQVAVLSYADGSPLARLITERGHRREVPVEVVPLPVREAVLAAQDRSFYEDREFDLTGTLRSAWNRVHDEPGRDPGGDPRPATITEQYVDTALGGAKGSLWRAYRELVVSVKIASERPKEQLLGDYLNATYFGRGAYGVQAAAQAYFGKDAADLTAAEGAVLAGVIGAPAAGDPAVSPGGAVVRWNSVLDGMVTQGWLTSPQRSALRFPPTVPRDGGVEGLPAAGDGHLVDAVVDELADLGVSEQDVAQDGLRITTTIDPTRQRQAVAATRAALALTPAEDRATLVALDPQTGGVLAYRGGAPDSGAPDSGAPDSGAPDSGAPGGSGDLTPRELGSRDLAPSDPGTNNSGPSSPDAGKPAPGDPGTGDEARARRPAGATYGPFAVLAGLQRDPGPDGEALDDRCPGCDLRQAMARDGDGVLDALARRVGPQAVTDAARAAGVGLPPDDRVGAGGQEVNAVDLASAYATIAAGGVWHRPHLVSTVATADGRVLYRVPTDDSRRFSPEVARGVTETMLDVAAYRGLSLPDDRPVAMATDDADTWTVGFTPSLVTVAWLDRDPLSRLSVAAGPSGLAWHDFMTAAVANRPVQQFPPLHPGGAPAADTPSAADRTRLPDAMPATPPTGSLSAPVAPENASPDRSRSAAGGRACAMLSPCR